MDLLCRDPWWASDPRNQARPTGSSFQWIWNWGILILYQFLLGTETVGTDKPLRIQQIQKAVMKKPRTNEVETNREIDHWGLRDRVTPAPEHLVPLTLVSHSTGLEWMSSVLKVSPIFLAKEISSFGSNGLFLVIISD